MLAGKADPLLFVQALALLTQLVSEVADHRRRLVADLAFGGCFRNHGQRLDLLADTEPFGSIGDRHAAGPADPGTHGDIAVDAWITGRLEVPNPARARALQAL